MGYATNARKKILKQVLEEKNAEVSNGITSSDSFEIDESLSKDNGYTNLKARQVTTVGRTEKTMN